LIAAILTSCLSSAVAAPAVLTDGPAVGGAPTDVVVTEVTVGPEDRLRVTSPDAQIVEAIPVDGGALRIRLVPDDVGRPGAFPLVVKVRGAHRADARLEVPVTPSAAGPLAIAFVPPDPVGAGAVEIQVRPSGAAPLPFDARWVDLRVSAGVVGDVRPSGDRWTAPYTPPPDRAGPLPVVVTARDRATSAVGVATLPLRFAHTLVATAPVGTEATVVVGGRPSGTAPVAADGTVSVDVVVGPGDGALLRFTDLEGGQEERLVEVPRGPDRVVGWVGVADGARFVAGRPFPAAAAAVDASGHPLLDAPITGAVSGGGAFVATAGAAAQAVVAVAPSTPGPFTVDLDGAPGVARYESVAPPAGLALTATRGPRGVDVVVLADREDGGGRLVVDGAPVALRFDRSGRATHRAPTDARWVAAIPAFPTSNLRPARVRLWVGHDDARVGGDTVPVFVVVEDVDGQPIADQDVSLSAPVGGGFVAPMVRTGSDGVGVVGYTPGLTAGLGYVVARSGPLAAGAVLWQRGPGDLGEAPVIGSEADRAATADRRARVPVRVVPP
jgi:hypothetical protein